MLRSLFILSLLINCSGFCFAQKVPATILNNLSVNGIRYGTNRESIIKSFGKASKQYKPHYECGFLSSDEQGEIFYTLDYKLMKWTGNKKSGYIMEELLITPGIKYRVMYKDKKLSSQTSYADFLKLSGMKDASKNPKSENTYIELQENSDDKYIFHFVKGKLRKIEYWSPC